MKNRYTISLVASILLAVFYATMQPFRQTLAVSSDLLFVLLPGFAGVFGFLGVRKFGWRSKLGLAFLGVFATPIFISSGNILLTVYDVLGIPVGFPSILDVIYPIGYLAALLAVGQFAWIFRKGLTRTRGLLGLATGVVLAAAFAGFLVLPILTSTENVGAKIVAAVYPALDVLIGVALALVLLEFGGSVFEIGWAWIFTGFLLIAAADVAYGVGVLDGWYYSGNPIELFYFWAFILLSVGLSTTVESLESLAR